MRHLGDDFEIEPISDRRWDKVRDTVMARLAEAEIPHAAPAPRRWIAVSLVAACAASVALFVIVHERHAGVHSHIVTGAQASQFIMASSVLDVAPHSTVTVEETAGQATTVHLEKGAIDCDVKPQAPGVVFAVDAGRVRVEVVGTHFSVARRGDDVAVRVVRGSVRVLSGSTASLVHTGEQWPAPPSAPAAPATPPPEPAQVQPPPIAPQAPVPHSALAPTGQDLYETAAGLEAKDPARAVSLYTELSTKRGAWAANALFARARLEADRGNLPEAHRLAAEYLRRFPHGPNAADARAVRARQRGDHLH